MLCTSFDAPLVYEETDAPPVRAGEVRIAVRACGVNFADTLMVKGLYQVKPPFPFSPGLEVAGEVVDVGAGVEQVKVGDRVVSICSYGGFAEVVSVPEATILPMPENMDFVSGAALPINYGTSYLALKERAHLQVGETLLVGGAAGGVGLTAIELGKLMGATVIAAASSPEKLAKAQEYGADFGINYTQESVRERVKALTDGRGADVIYDPVGGDFFDEAMRVINWGGRLVVVGFASGRIPEVAANRLLIKNCAVMGVFLGGYMFNDPQTLFKTMQAVMALYAEGKLKPPVFETYHLSAANEALAALVGRQTMGKLVLTVG